jgi:hypothetical protein
MTFSCGAASALCPAAFLTLGSFESIETLPCGASSATLKVYSLGETSVKSFTVPSATFSELAWKPVTGCEKVAVTGRGSTPVGLLIGIENVNVSVGFVVGVVDAAVLGVLEDVDEAVLLVLDAVELIEVAIESSASAVFE